MINILAVVEPADGLIADAADNNNSVPTKGARTTSAVALFDGLDRHRSLHSELPDELPSKNSDAPANECESSILASNCSLPSMSTVSSYSDFAVTPLRESSLVKSLSITGCSEYKNMQAKLLVGDLRRTATCQSIRRNYKVMVREGREKLSESESDPCMKLVASINASLERSALVHNLNLRRPAADGPIVASNDGKKLGVIEFLQQADELQSWFDALEARLAECHLPRDVATASRCERLITLDYLLVKLHEKMPFVASLRDAKCELVAAHGTQPIRAAAAGQIEEHFERLEARWRTLADRLHSYMLLGDCNTPSTTQADFDDAVLTDVESDVAAFSAWLDGVEQSHFVPFREYVRTSVNMHELKIVAKGDHEQPAEACVGVESPNLETMLETHQRLQNEIEARSRFITAVLKACDMFERRSFLLQRDEPDSTRRDAHCERLRSLRQAVAALENGLHQKWLESLEFKFLIEQLLALADVCAQSHPRCSSKHSRRAVSFGGHAVPLTESSPRADLHRVPKPACSESSSMQEESDDAASSMQFQLELECGPLACASTPSTLAARSRKHVGSKIRASPKRLTDNCATAQLNCTWPLEQSSRAGDAVLPTRRSLEHLFDQTARCDRVVPSVRVYAASADSGKCSRVQLERFSPPTNLSNVFYPPLSESPSSAQSSSARFADLYSRPSSASLQSHLSTSPNLVARFGTDSHRAAANRYYVMTATTADSDSEVPRTGLVLDEDARLDSVMERIAQAYAGSPKDTPPIDTPALARFERDTKRRVRPSELPLENTCGLSESVDSKSTKQLIEEVEQLVTPNASMMDPFNCCVDGSSGSDGDQFDRAEYASKALATGADDAAADLLWDHFIVPPHGTARYGPSSDEEEANARARADRFVHQIWDVELTAGASSMPLPTHSAALLNITAAQRRASLQRNIEPPVHECDPPWSNPTAATEQPHRIDTFASTVVSSDEPALYAVDDCSVRTGATAATNGPRTAKRACERRRAERHFELRMKAHIAASRRREFYQPPASADSSPAKPECTAFRSASASTSPNSTPRKRGRRAIRRSPARIKQIRQALFDEDGTTSGRDCETTTEDGRANDEDDTKSEGDDDTNSIASLKLNLKARDRLTATKHQSAAEPSRDAAQSELAHKCDNIDLNEQTTADTVRSQLSPGKPCAHSAGKTGNLFVHDDGKQLDLLRTLSDMICESERSWALLRTELVETLMQNISVNRARHSGEQVATIRAKLDELARTVENQLHALHNGYSVESNSDALCQADEDGGHDIQDSVATQLFKWTRFGHELSKVVQSANRFTNVLSATRSTLDCLDRQADQARLVEDGEHSNQRTALLANFIRYMNAEPPLKWLPSTSEADACELIDNSGTVPDDPQTSTEAVEYAVVSVDGLDEIARAVKSAIGALSVDQRGTASSSIDDELLRAISTQLTRLLLAEFADLYARVAASRERLISLAASSLDKCAVPNVSADSKVYRDEATGVDTDSSEYLLRRTVATSTQQTEANATPRVRANAGGRRWLSRYAKVCIIVFGCLLGLTLCISLVQTDESDAHSCEYSALQNLRSRFDAESRPPPV